MRKLNQSMVSNGKANGKLLLMKQPMLMGTCHASAYLFSRSGLEVDSLFKCRFEYAANWTLLHKGRGVKPRKSALVRLPFPIEKSSCR